MSIAQTMLEQFKQEAAGGNIECAIAPKAPPNMAPM